MGIVHPEEKKLRRTNVNWRIRKRKNVSIENSLMKKVKIKNEFEGEQKKK